MEPRAYKDNGCGRLWQWKEECVNATSIAFSKIKAEYDLRYSNQYDSKRCAPAGSLRDKDHSYLYRVPPLGANMCEKGQRCLTILFLHLYFKWHCPYHHNHRNPFHHLWAGHYQKNALPDKVLMYKSIFRKSRYIRYNRLWSLFHLHTSSFLSCNLEVRR